MSIFDIFTRKKKINAPWEKYYTKDDLKYKIPDITMYDQIVESTKKYPNNVAIKYMGKTINYKSLLKKIDICAKGFHSLGIKQGDIVTIMLPNVPEALISFYALNKIGAVVNILHPLLSENEVKNALNAYSTVMLVAMDISYAKIKNIVSETNVYKVVVISAKDSMGSIMKIGYEITQGRKVEKPKASELYIYWKDFYTKGLRYSGSHVEVVGLRDTPAVILQSGGSTGTPKGIVLSNGNFNSATIAATKAYPDLCSEDRILGFYQFFMGLV